MKELVYFSTRLDKDLKRDFMSVVKEEGYNVQGITNKIIADWLKNRNQEIYNPWIEDLKKEKSKEIYKDFLEVIENG